MQHNPWDPQTEAEVNCASKRERERERSNSCEAYQRELRHERLYFLCMPFALRSAPALLPQIAGCNRPRISHTQQSMPRLPASSAASNDEFLLLPNDTQVISVESEEQLVTSRYT